MDVTTRRCGPRLLLSFLLAGCLLTLPSPSLAATRQTLADLPLPAQAAVSATLGKDQPAYYAKQQGAGFTFENPRHAFTATLTAEGLALKQRGGTVTLQLSGIGYGSPSQRVRNTAPLARANRVEYRRGPLTEWYVNGPLGLEQGVTLSAPPGPRTGGPLTLAFAIGGAAAPLHRPHGDRCEGRHAPRVAEA